MICRLCLCELHEFVSIFNEFETHAESGIAKLIAKYFHIELQLDDAVSNKICNSCLKHLNEFHDFWLLIEGKQQTLLKELSNFKCDLIVDDLAVVPLFEIAEEDVKNVPLYEPTIDTVFPEKITPETNQLETIGLSGGKIATNRPKRSVVIEAINENEKAADNTSESSADEDFYLSNLDVSTESSDDSDIKSLEKNSKRKRKKLTRNPKGKFAKTTDSSTKLQCDECHKMLADNRSLRNHMARRHASKEDLNFECDICKKKFAKQYVLDRHLATHRKPDNLITCELCQIRFYTKQELRAHEKTKHADVFKSICDSCGKGFKTKAGFTKHYKEEHLGIIPPSLQCQICNEWLKNNRSLWDHMQKHRDESSGKDFVCKICGVVKSTKKRLASHKEYHHSNKIHKCKICNKEFKVPIALEEHMAALHTGQSLYSCCFCPRTFKCRANMYTHKRRIHSNEWVPKGHQPRKKIMASKNDAIEVEQFI